MDLLRCTPLVEEAEVEREAHAEGVDARAARDQQAGAGFVAVEEGQAEEASAKARGHPHLAPERGGHGEALEPRCQGLVHT